MGSSTSSTTQPPSSLPKIHLLLMENKHTVNFTVAAKKLSLPSSIHYEIHNTPLSSVPQTLNFDAIVSPANSFARLDGAFDDALSRAFAPKNDYHALTRVAQRTVYEQWKGFAPPGTCTVVDLDGDGEAGQGEEGGLRKREETWGCRYLLLCPTMRVPMNVVWDREVVYECVWALLNAVWNHNKRVDAELNEDDEMGGEEVVVGDEDETGDEIRSEEEERLRDEEEDSLESGKDESFRSEKEKSLKSEKEKSPEGKRKGGWKGKKRATRIDSFMMTPLATGCGGINAQRWAEQAVLAIKHFHDAVAGGENGDGGKWRSMGWDDVLDITAEVAKTIGFRGND